MSLRAAQRGPVGECFQVLPYGEKITDLLITVCLAALNNLPIIPFSRQWCILSLAILSMD